MNLTKQSSDNKYSAKPYFNFVLKQNWQHLVLYAIIVILCMILPCVMFVNDLVESADRYSSSVLLSKVENIARNISIIGVFISCGIAVLAGMSSLSYVNSAKNVGCYHSFPIRREHMFITETATRVIYYLASILFGYGVSYAMIFVFFPKVSYYIGEYCTMAAAGIILFLLIYCIMLFAAGLTGSAVMRFLMTLVIMFLPIIMYALVICTLTLSNKRIYESYYFTYDILEMLCPICKAIQSTVDTYYTGIAPMLIHIVEAAAFYVGAIFLHKYRKSESSGTTIIWKPIFILVKYLVIFAAGLLGILIFGSGIFDSEGGLSYVFGAVIGLVIAFITVNCIFYRSSKAMFKGVKSFAVFTVCFIAAEIIFVNNVFGFVGRPYLPASTDKLELIVNDIHMVYTENEDIERVTDYLNEYIENGYSVEKGYQLPYIYSDTNDDIIQSKYYNTSKTVFEQNNGEYLEDEKYFFEENYADYYSSYQSGVLVQVPGFGIPLCLSIEFDANGEFWKEILMTEEYEKQLDLASWADSGKIANLDISIGDNTLYIENAYISTSMARAMSEETVQYVTDVQYADEYSGFKASEEGQQGKEYIEKLLPLMTYSTEKAKNSPIVGVICIQYDYSEYDYEFGRGTGIIKFPVYAEDIELINTVIEIGYGIYEKNGLKLEEEMTVYDSSEDYIIRTAFKYNEPFLVDLSTGEAHLLDSSTLAELLRDTSVMSIMSRYLTRSIVLGEQNDYAILVNSQDGSSQSWLFFREDAVTKSELDSIFDRVW